MKNKNLRKIEKTQRGFVLAEGEVTDHAHVIQQDVELFQDTENDNKKWMIINSPISIMHEEHDQIDIETPGEFEVGIVQEYDHLMEEARKVAD